MFRFVNAVLLLCLGSAVAATAPVASTHDTNSKIAQQLVSIDKIGSLPQRPGPGKSTSGEIIEDTNDFDTIGNIKPGYAIEDYLCLYPRLAVHSVVLFHSAAADRSRAQTHLYRVTQRLRL